MGENEVTASSPVASNGMNRAFNENGKVKPGRRTEDAATEGLVRVRALVADLGARESDARRRINEQRGELTELQLRDHQSTLELTSASRRLERADAEVARLEAEVRHLAGAAAELAVARDRIQQLKRHRHDLRERLSRVHASRGYRMIVALRRVRAGFLRPFCH